MSKTSLPIPVRDAWVLAGFALIIGYVLLLTERCTHNAIQQNKLHTLNQTISAVLPPDTYDNDPLTNTLTLTHDGKARKIYRAFDNNQPVAAAITAVASDGYSGNIELLVGISYNGIISGVRVLSHSETPGLGDKIEIRKSHWIVDFEGKSLNDKKGNKDGNKSDNLTWTVKKDGGDFDQFTGATITPRAVVKEVKRTLDWFSDHRQQIFEQ